MEKQIETQTGEKADMEIKGDTATVTTGQGETKVTTVSKNTDSWCQVGSEWKLTSSGEDIGNAEWKVQGIITSGQFDGLCHITYRAESGGETMSLDYYVDEAGENGYMEMSMNGQKYTSQWSADN